MSSMASHTSENYRQRISFACDRCNEQRKRCTGQRPCSSCSEIGALCSYARDRKKRGRRAKSRWNVITKTSTQDKPMHPDVAPSSKIQLVDGFKYDTGGIVAELQQQCEQLKLRATLLSRLLNDREAQIQQLLHDQSHKL